MTALISQGVALLAIILIGAFVFSKYKLTIRIKDLTIASLLIVLSIILGIFSIVIPFFGFETFKIGFSQMPLMLIGVLLGPSWAFISGVTQDLLGLLLDPTSYPFFGFTLNKVIISVVPAICFHSLVKVKEESFQKGVIGILVLFISAALISVYHVDTFKYEETVIVLNIWMKIGFGLFFSIVFGLIGFGIYYVKSKMKTEDLKLQLNRWISAVLLVEIIVQICLTPFWLDVMYGVPFLFSALTRLLKSSFMIVLNIMIGQFVLRILRKTISL